MRPVTVSVTGTGTAVVPLDWRVDPFNVGVGCVVSGAATYNVEHSYENPPVDWFVDPNVSGKTANAETSYPGGGTNPPLGPFQFLRLNMTAGSGTVTMTVITGGH